MNYAEISVNSPVAQRRTFSYAIPPGMHVTEGMAVLVPFGARVLQGIVVVLSAVPSVEDTRDILEVIGTEPLVSPGRLAIARWISEYYLSPLFESIALMLPPGFERAAVARLHLVRPPDESVSLTDAARQLLDLLAPGPQEMRAVEKALGKKRAASVVPQLVRRGYVQRTYSLTPVRVKPKQEERVAVLDREKEASGLPSRQETLYRYLLTAGGEVPWSEVRRATNVDRSVLKALLDKELVASRTVEVRRGPVVTADSQSSQPLTLTAPQQAALDEIIAAIETPAASPNHNVFLLHGVTASGKTEVYLRALAQAMAQGKKGIVMVPEIALTPQTIERFASRFPGRVAVLHSGLTLGEQYDEWHRIAAGGFDVVIGPRSAVFAPQPDLGIIIIDEEHEWTYKQDNTPRYHAREVALKVAEQTGATVVLGSATPDVESYQRASMGRFRLLTLPERIPAAGGVLPAVEIVDMREELKAGNSGMFSRLLTQSVNEALQNHEQVILFLNRRGGSLFIQCRRCGFVLRCRRCEVPLSHHLAGDMLTCHQCGAHYPVPDACPRCAGRRLKYLGTGTQKLEQEVRLAFPRARVIRWDSDTTVARNAHREILTTFREGRADILIGTQMVAKGLDIPAVTLVGVMNADTALNLPDFRAGERTFQLLTQVAGRAGRGDAGGRVIIQTYTPDNFAVQAAARHDYLDFYEREMEYRRQLRNPPFSQLARLVYAHVNDDACRREAERMLKVITDEMAAAGIAGIECIGPAPAFLHRLRGRYRWHTILRGSNLSPFLSRFSFPAGWSVDIDPLGILQ